MAEYKGIHGTKIQNYTSDPTNPIIGQVWYNETSQTMKVQSATTVGAWATSANLNTRRYGLGGAGTSNDSGIVFGGFPNGPTGATESYNGSAWTEVNDLNHGRGYIPGLGTITAALTTGGNSATIATDTQTESYNGTGAGTQTSGLYIGGYIPPAVTGVVESWNGTSWTETTDLNTARSGGGGAGVDNTSALIGGGGTPPSTGATEEWNGSSWTEVNDLNTARKNQGGVGIVTSALIFGGQTNGAPSRVGNTETWNGTSWTEDADLSLARVSLSSSGTATVALAAGGYDGAFPFENSTEEWTGAGAPQTKTITSS